MRTTTRMIKKHVSLNYQRVNLFFTSARIQVWTGWLTPVYKVRDPNEKLNQNTNQTTLSVENPPLSRSLSLSRNLTFSLSILLNRKDRFPKYKPQVLSIKFREKGRKSDLVNKEEELSNWKRDSA